MTLYRKQTGREFESPQLHKNMVMKKYYYERSNLLESEVNINFEELLWMNEEETEEWIESLRSFIISEWD